jgi:hypothetical protein
MQTTKPGNHTNLANEGSSNGFIAKAGASEQFVIPGVVLRIFGIILWLLIAYKERNISGLQIFLPYERCREHRLE